MSATALYLLHTISSFHPGAGRGSGFIDMPIMREEVTNWPMTPSSSIKGVMREYFSSKSEQCLNLAFGKPDEGGNLGNAGALMFNDARIVCLPVQSPYGTFAYVTSPLVLRRLKRDMELLFKTQLPQHIPCSLKPGVGHITTDSALDPEKRNKLYLKDLDLVCRECDIAHEWADRIAEWVFVGEPEWQEFFKKRFCIVDDYVFGFLTETATEVRARIRVNPESGTVTKGALWYVEYLPAETILAGEVICDKIPHIRNAPDLPTQQDLLKQYCRAPINLRLGGNKTVGKGHVRVVFHPNDTLEIEGKGGKNQ